MKDVLRQLHPDLGEHELVELDVAVRRDYVARTLALGEAMDLGIQIPKDELEGWLDDGGNLSPREHIEASRFIVEQHRRANGPPGP